jgi:methyl-accepting chemotaxis protein
MDQSTQQNAAMVEETSAAARSLTAEVASLLEQAAKFRTGSANASSDRKPARAPLDTVPEQRVRADTKRDTGYRSPVKALPAVKSASVATVAADDDDWNAF